MGQQDHAERLPALNQISVRTESVQWYPFLFLPRQVPICSKAQGHILSGRYRAYPQYPHPHHLHLPIVQVDGAVIFSDPKDSLGPPGLQKSWLNRVLEERPNTTE